MNKTFDERWTVEAYNDEGNIVKLQRTADICDAVELAKAMEECPPRGHHHAERFGLCTMGVERR